MSARPAAWSLNARAVFDALLAHGMLTRGEIAESTGLSRVTASGVVEQLIRRGIVEYAATVPWSSGGPNARTYALRPTAAYVVGVAAHLDRIAVATATITGDVLAESTCAVEAGGDTADRFHRLILESLAAAAAPVERLHRVVVGTPGVVDPSAQGYVSFTSDVRSWQADITSLGGALGCPVICENDVKLAALSEMHLGAGRGVRDLVLAWIDDGFALGAIVGGRLLRGDHGWAGEIGFMPAAVTGPVVGTRRGGTHVATVQSALNAHGIYALGEHFGVAQADVLAAMSARFTGVAGADTLFAEIAHRVALAIAPPILILDPDVVVLTGSVALAGGQPLLDSVIAELREFGPLPLSIMLSELDREAVAQGAVLLALADARDGLFDGTSADEGLDPL
ncbi:MAG: ROK family transcriptional regulator [Mycobacteriales bacterium]